MLADRVVTPAQMDAINRTYRSCRPEPTRVDARGRRAVIRYGVEQRRCAPWLLVREDDRWRLDLVESQRAIRFGAGNAWHFAERPEGPYAFAFSDWRLDRNGFPRPN